MRSVVGAARRAGRGQSVREPAIPPSGGRPAGGERPGHPTCWGHRPWSAGIPVVSAQLYFSHNSKCPYWALSQPNPPPEASHRRHSGAPSPTRRRKPRTVAIAARRRLSGFGASATLARRRPADKRASVMWPRDSSRGKRQAPTAQPQQTCLPPDRGRHTDSTEG